MIERDSAPAVPRRAGSWLDGPCAWLAWLLPLVLGVWSTTSAPRWQDDLAIVRDLGLIPAGSEGALSTVLSQLFALLPVAGRCARAGLVGVLALAACSALMFSLSRALLEARRPFGLNPVLALLGCQIWALSPLVREDAGGPGSGALPLLLVLLGVRLTQLPAASTDARVFPLAGVLLGLSFGESHAAALLLLGVLLADWLQDAAAADVPWLRFAAGFALAAGSCWLVPWLRTLAPNTWVDLGLRALPSLPPPLPGASSAWVGWSESVQQVLAPAIERLGVVVVVLALAGAVTGLAERERRRCLLPWALLGLAGSIAPLGLAGAAQTLGLCALAGSAGVAAFVPVALQTALAWLWSRPLPFARPASVLGAAFAVTLVLQRLESARPSAAPSELALEVWTDAALGGLPAESVVLVQNPALELRRLAAQVLQGVRADVLTVPIAWLHRGSITERLVRRAPDLAPVLRQLAVNGSADEYALSRLADLRPLFVELDPRWDARLLDHLRPEAFWLGFAPHALGKRERQAGVARSRAALRQLLDDPDLQGTLDESTRQILARQAGQQALTLAALGETRPAQQVLRLLRRIRPRDPLARELAARLDQSRGRVAVNDLLAAAARH